MKIIQVVRASRLQVKSRIISKAVVDRKKKRVELLDAINQLKTGNLTAEERAKIFELLGG